jgi:hypothetical protein
MLHCVMIVGQIFLVGGNEVPVNFNTYSYFTVEESWGEEYYLVAHEYDGNTDRYLVGGVITNEMIPAVLNNCVANAK